MSSIHAGRPAHDNRQAAAADRLGQLIAAVDDARANAEVKVWHFASSTDARAAIRHEGVEDGDVLVVESERAVAIVVVYPVAITAERGAFQPYASLGRPAREYGKGLWTRSVERAEQAAIELGAPLADPAAAQAARTGTGKPAPIEIPRLLAEPGDVLHAFGARLRIVDTGTRTGAAGQAEWWAIVEGATEQDSRRTYRGRWSFAVPVATAAWDVVLIERVLPAETA